MAEKKYIPAEDPYFSKPYFDVQEWRDTPVRHYYVHGGFHDTTENGSEVRFCFYFPAKDRYEGRFFQYLSPAPEDERESEHLTGEENRILFALTHGAYFVISNQGGFQLDDPERLWKSSANAAELSRKVAAELYGTDKRPYGYVYGGSGGSFKTVGCLEATEGIWDGGVPYVIANPMAVPNNFSPRVRVMRLLGEEGLKRLVEATEPGGSGDILEGFDKEQQEAILEARRMGFPDRAWFAWDKMGDGALMVLAPYIYQVMPEYFKDFWTKKGFAGADPDGADARDRVYIETTVTEVIREDAKEESFTNVDNSWQNVITRGKEVPKLRVSGELPEGSSLYHCNVRVLDGKAKGKECPVDSMDGDVINLSGTEVAFTHKAPLEGIQAGDRILIDNSDYIAMQTFQRYQVPDESYHAYDQYRNADGTLKYPQLSQLLSPVIAKNGAGIDMTGNIHGKILVVCSLLDESAFPWHGDWYKHAVEKKLQERGEKLSDCFRLYYNDHCLHGDAASELGHPEYQVSYITVVYQALLDLAAWCEEGKTPLPSTQYRIEDGQVLVPDTAKERRGLQPVVHAFAEGERAVHVKAGDTVHFTAKIEVPEGAGTVTRAAWDYEGDNDWYHEEHLTPDKDGGAVVNTTHVFTKPGTYFPVVKVQSSRTGSADDLFLQCHNLERVRVVVE